MPRVFFVGCGPGDPELVTVKALRLIREADVIVYSGSLIPEPIIRMAGEGAELHDASGLVREEIFELLYRGAEAGKTVLRLHDGDPSIYGAIREQMDALLKRGIESEVVPGVTAFLASAAALGTQLTLPGVTQTLIITRAESRTKVPGAEGISGLAGHGATMIFYLSVHLLEEIVEGVLAGGGGYDDSTPAAVVFRAGWDDQRIVRGTLADIVQKTREARITKTAVVLIGEALDPASYEYSRLYDKEFSHGYRKAVSNAPGRSQGA